MNKFQKVFVTSLTMLFLGTSLSNAQEDIPPISLPLVSFCNAGEIVRYNLKEELKEQAVATASLNILNMSPEGLNQLSGTLYVYVNVETLEYTLVSEFEEQGIMCIIGSGKDFGPYVEGKEL